MIAIDWVLIGLVGVSALFGMMRGLIGVLASLAAWILAGLAAFQFGARVALLLAGSGEPGAGHLFAGYALAFIVVMIVVGIAGWMLRTLVHSVGLSGVDRMLGFVVGVVRGLVIACALLLLIGLTELPREPSWKSSPVVPLLVPGAEQMRTWLPEWVAAQVDLRGDGDGPALLSSDTLPRLPRPVTPPAAPDAVTPDAPASGPVEQEAPLPTPARSAPSGDADKQSVLPAERG
ncbi:CvpA family protein [Lysobacter sp. H21R4]|uniref:CvpA family protein n=1 Tax=Lysobacter sp. H21R4 TaxID=2781021 RepID=UPI001887B42D|nr:CvpA family protein [Lysobacter sp. H21R4]QOY63209.1 CvpA family protein [Lysobacter sp. H21R4]